MEGYSKGRWISGLRPQQLSLLIGRVEQRGEAFDGLGAAGRLGHHLDGLGSQES
ncbi:hypothetical protein M878_07430 [Streptomyces roseochromogenus subsp. oscitans DS 12.976]|uniref:Uncharacterized protein n=1 Tax=Streptomyces roseochromogenus subsp. oscitans DS 12.976 TaxID=1352936 RepID=V6KSE1_STRRC|nr:hypothetical protein M878_07430 [Streptomyces roseochromogenus subsp. oscitans DS 12.976]